MEAAVEAQSNTQLRPGVATAVLLALILLVFAPSVGAPFHLDDTTLFSDPVVTSASGWWYVWQPLRTRPLTYFTFWLNYQLGGQNPIGYHAINVCLHVLATWLLYRLLARVAGAKAALIAATLFALHPVQVEPVAYVFERATLLAAVFCFISAKCWLDGDFWPAAGFFIFALLSKEECVAFPLFLLLIRRALFPAICMLFLSLVAGTRVLLALQLLHISGAGSRAGISPFDYFSTQGTVIWRYLRLLVVPYGFTCDPDITIVRGWLAWVAWAALLLLALLVWKLHSHGKWFVAGLVLLLPSSSIFPAEDLAADRRLYLPMAAFACFAGLTLVRVTSRPVLLAAALGLAAFSAQRIQVWRSEERLWAEAVEWAPRKLRPRVLLSRASDAEKALQMLDAAEALAARDPRPMVEKAVRLMAAHLPERALPELEHALQVAPNNVSVLNTYGVALSMIGRRDDAVEQFRHALRVNPCSPIAAKGLQELGVQTATTDCR
jgi:hypothetical protein